MHNWKEITGQFSAANSLNIAYLLVIKNKDYKLKNGAYSLKLNTLIEIKHDFRNIYTYIQGAK